MAGILNIYTWWQRLRHSRGFGIHSPFAYRFITEVLNQPYAYYAYDSLPLHPQRLIYRVALSFGPGAAYCCAPPQYEKAARMALPAKGEIKFVLIDMETAEEKQWQKALQYFNAGTPIMALNAADSPRIAAAIAAMRTGMTFTNAAGTTIAVPFPHLPLHHLQVKY